MRVRELRGLLLARGLTLGDVAKSLGVSRQFVSQVAHGQRSNERVRAALAGAIGKPVAVVFPVPNSKRPTARASQAT